MSKDVCIALTAVFPLILIIVLLDGRHVRGTFRKKKVYDWTVAGGATCGVFGLILSVIGVQTEGLAAGLDILNWVFFAASAAALGTMVALLALTFDHRDGKSNMFQRAREAKQ